MKKLDSQLCFSRNSCIRNLCYCLIIIPDATGCGPCIGHQMPVHRTLRVWFNVKPNHPVTPCNQSNEFIRPPPHVVEGLNGFCRPLTSSVSRLSSSLPAFHLGNICTTESCDRYLGSISGDRCRYESGPSGAQGSHNMNKL